MFDSVNATGAFKCDVERALSRSPKIISPKWLYDDRGSALFEAITELPEYYPTRTEMSIFRARFPEIAALVAKDSVLIEYGAGAARKTEAAIRALAPVQYIPIDIAGDFLELAAEGIRARFPALEVTPVVADFLQDFPLPETADAPRVGFFPGSTIGNLEPAQAINFLCRMRTLLGADGTAIIGVDMVKDTAILEAAYDDAAGVTAAFNRNLLERINRELDADFDVASFAHVAMFNAAQSRIEMHLRAERAMVVHIDDKVYHFARGETLHTENSYKYTSASFAQLADAAGFAVAASFTDAQGWFGVFVLRGAR